MIVEDMDPVTLAILKGRLEQIADEMDGWEIELLGEQLSAKLQPQPLFDANGSRMRG